VTLDDQFVAGNQPQRHQVEVENQFRGGGDLESEVLSLVREDPFASIREMTRELQSQPFFSNVGWWRVFGILRRNRLLKRRSRFRFVRARRRDRY
jgi:hypothetical protein